MVDRIEELLAGLETEDDEDREDVPVLETAALPASPRGDGEKDGDGTEEAVENLELPPVELGERGGGRFAGEIAAERPGQDAGPGEPGMAGDAADSLWKPGPVWTVRRDAAEMESLSESAPRGRTAEAPQMARDAGTALAEDGEWAVPAAALAGVEWAARARPVLPGPGDAGGAAPERAGLDGLYRQTVRAVWPAAPALPQEAAGRAVRAREPEGGLAAAVDELDRAVRRDSRRYDGGMSIF